MEKLTIKEKEVEDFIRNERTLFASDGNKRFYIRLRNHKKYVIQEVKTGFEKPFSNIGKAVQFFNSI